MTTPTNIHRRRLRPVRAFMAGLKGLPRLWGQGWVGLVLLSLMIPLCSVAAGEALTRKVWLALVIVFALGSWTGLTAIALDRDPPPGGVALGPRLWRALWAAVLNLIFLAMIATVLVLVSLAIFGVSGLDLEAIQARDWANVGPIWQLVVLGLLALIVVLVPLLLIVRLSLFVQATVGRGHTVSLNTMGVAQGSFWPLMALFLVLAVPPLAFLGWAGTQRGLALAVLGVIWLWIPLSAGALAAAYGQLEYWSPSLRDRQGGN